MPSRLARLWIAAAIVTAASAGCSVGSRASTHSVALEWELWPYKFSVSDSGCHGGYRAGAASNLAANSVITLVGPDGAELATTTLGNGVLEPPSANLRDRVTNFPSRNVCFFRATFDDVPEVATYRVKTADGGVVETVNYSLRSLSDRSWTYGIVSGARWRE